jgi:phosphohistidine phosphatase
MEHRLKEHRLVLLRHAKSDWPQGVDDLERPLSERGRVDAAAAGRELAALGVPDLLLCSPARRTRQTARLALEGLGKALGSASIPALATRFESVIYGASVPELVGLLRAVPAQIGSVLLIGHEPTMSATARELAGPGSAAGALDRLEIKYPTSGMAVFRLEADWVDLEPGKAVLEKFVVPRG